MNRRDFIYVASIGAALAMIPMPAAAQGNRDTEQPAAERNDIEDHHP